MSIKQKAVSTAASAALLASLLSATVAGTASAAAIMSPSTGLNTGGTLVSISGGSGYNVTTQVIVCVGLAQQTTVAPTSISPDGTALTFVTPDVSPFAGLCQVDTAVTGSTPGLPGFFYTSAAPGVVTLTPVSVSTTSSTTAVTLSAPGQGTFTNGTTTVTVTCPTGGAIAGIPATVTSGTSLVFVAPLHGTAETCAVTTVAPATVGVPALTYGTVVTLSMVPTSGAIGSAVQLSGSAYGFDLACRISINGGALITPTSVGSGGTSMTFVVPTGTTTGTVLVTLCSTYPAAKAESAGKFTVSTTAGGTAVAPSTASSSGGTVIQVTAPSGTTYNGASLVRLVVGAATCAADIVPTSVASTGASLTFVMPAFNATAPTNMVACGATNTSAVSVFAIGSLGLPAVANGTVTYAAPAGAPVVSAVSPNTGSRLGGNTVTITGSAFVSGAKVSFGAALATSVTFVSATSLTAVVPAGVGVVPVIVQNPDLQSGQLANAYTYQDTGYVCGNATALGVTTSGPFSTSTKVAALNGYVTYAMGCGVAAAGQIITIQRSVQTPASGGGTWSAFTPFTSRVANSGGTVYFYIRSSSAAWWSFRASIASVVSPARQARWR